MHQHCLLQKSVSYSRHKEKVQSFMSILSWPKVDQKLIVSKHLERIHFFQLMWIDKSPESLRIISETFFLLC